MPPVRKSMNDESASDIFVDRQPPKKVFEDAAFSIPSDGCSLRVWHGVGGQGKSALARELFKISGTDPSYAHLRRAMVNLHGRKKSDPDLLMVWIRNEFAKSGLSMPAFDLAFAIMWEATRGDEPFPTFHNPWLHRMGEGSKEVAADTVTLAQEVLTEVTETIPVLRTLVKRGARWAFDKSKEVWLERTRSHLKHLYRDGQIKEPYELSKLMPWMLAQDLNQHLKTHPEDRFALFVDEYESVFDAGGMGKRWEDNKFDSYLREFITYTNGLLVLFFSREWLKWEDSSDWKGDLSGHQHLLGGLSDIDANDWLKEIPVPDQAIRDAMVEGARESDSVEALIYPLLLDLQVEHWRNLGGKASAEDFHVSEKNFEGRREILVRRLLRDYPKEIEEVLHFASIPMRFDRTAFQYILSANNIPLSFNIFEELKALSIVSEDEDGWLSIHRAIADAIVQMDKERTEHRAFLREHFEQRGKPDQPVDVNQQTLAALSEAIRLRLQEGPEGVVDWFESALETVTKAYRTSFLEDAWRQAYAYLDQALSETHPDTVQQIGNQGRYQEAEAEFREILEIIRHPDVRTSQLIGKIGPRPLSRGGGRVQGDLGDTAPARRWRYSATRQNAA